MSKFIDPQLIKGLLHYNAETGVFTWKPRPIESFKSRQAFLTWNKRFANKRAGSVKTGELGYKRRKIKIGSSYLMEHRLAWVYMTGEQPPVEIDHENRDATDNRWSNLKASDHLDNARNQSLSRNNKSGISGVSWKSDLGKWRARCMKNRQEHHLGYFIQKSDAEQAVKEFRAKNGFSAGHGTPKTRTDL
ncbi:hypothetical protein HaloA020_28910 [Halomonas sp. A020]|uniref:HNH endonuclease n=1 Tax=Halomonas sp. A020 TaxID=2717374 RepID=UPI00248F4C8A|nr:HNH endonuclease [Halomonas sp. A020]BCB62190.1 hypothetical protein HaloA020_28910 [Halomonas sp. A020]